MSSLDRSPQGQAAPRVLGADNVAVRFGGVTANADVTLAIAGGEILGLIGPNGAGKTTLVNCLSGFQRPTDGRVLLDGVDTSGWTTARFRREGVSRTFQAGRLFKNLTALENVEVAGVSLGLGRRRAKAAALELLGWLGIASVADKPAGILPYTDERRVGIARALIMAPAFLLLDEPAAGMSDHECEDLMQVITSIPRDHGCGVLLIEHNISLIMAVCGRVHVLDGGRTLFAGLPAEAIGNAAVIGAYLGADAT